jgi:hypothetical protein
MNSGVVNWKIKRVRRGVEKHRTSIVAALDFAFSCSVNSLFAIGPGSVRIKGAQQVRLLTHLASKL